MAKKSSDAKGIKALQHFSLSNAQRLVLGSFLILFSVLLLLSIISYFFTGESDQSILGDFTNRSVETKNWLSKIGAWISHQLVFKGFGVASILFSGLVAMSGITVLLNTSKQRLYSQWIWGTLIVIWTSITFGFLFSCSISQQPLWCYLLPPI